jgi:toxin ParE1/3/4
VAYLVRIARRAERDLSYLYEEINAADSPTARRWYEGLRRAIVSLAVHPKRCPTTAENRNLRHLLYGRKPNVYRVIYRVNERQRQVDVLHIRHGARRKFRASDIG